jgi:segregation and condensation protein B
MSESIDETTLNAVEDVEDGAALEDVEDGDVELETSDDVELETSDGALGAPSLTAAVEALLLLADEPMTVLDLASAVRQPSQDVELELRRLSDEYSEQGRGFDLREVAGGWRYYTRAECSPLVERFVLDGQQARLTQASLETLAVIAYRQPITRGRVSAVRGVNVDGVIRTLLTRGLIAEAGHDGESGAHLYRTTSHFLERMGIASLDDLPPLAEHLPDLADLEDVLDSVAKGD